MSQASIESAEQNSSEASTGGSLLVVGLGISPGHLTLDTVKALRSCDVVFCLTTNPLSQSIIEDQNKDVRSLQGCYAPGKPRPESYDEMVDLVMAEVRRGKNVCFGVYGHPGVFAHPTHEAIRIALAEGFDALMLPGVSAEDCIYADLALDPGKHGCQSFEATDFVYRERVWDPYSILMLWQVSVIGVMTLPDKEGNPAGFEMLRKRLIDCYGPDHKGTLYEAPSLPLCYPRTEEKTFAEMTIADFRPETTFVIRPIANDPRKNEKFNKLIR